MALGLADWMVVPEVVGIALVAGVANYALKKNTIDLKAQWKDLDWGSLVGAPRREDSEDDDLPSFKFTHVIEPLCGLTAVLSSPVTHKLSSGWLVALF
jgi:hypothetical protein